MTRKLFQPGGPLGIRDLGNDQYRMDITIPKDADGRVARECPSVHCSPAYFKVKPGTGITRGQVVAFCPYCRHEAEPNGFATREQVRYAKDLAIREAHKGVEALVKDALGMGSSGKRSLGGGLISMTMKYKPGTLPHVRRPFEDEVRRDAVCPHCTLDHTVFGLATWCADCGEDIFLSHVQAELEVTRSMVSDVERRGALLGTRVAAKDLENCLEDAVSIFEAALKAMTRRRFSARGESPEQVETRLRKLGNTFQNIARTQEQLAELFGVAGTDNVDWTSLQQAFEKRHPITHNLGVVDRKYLERAQAAERQGREVRITEAEVEALLVAVSVAVGAIHAQLFPAAKRGMTGGDESHLPPQDPLRGDPCL